MQPESHIYMNTEEHIVPIFMNGLHGRMMRLPAAGTKKREILLVYGHHASIERIAGIAESLSEYGNVTVPDLPGFGGMEPMYKLGEKPTLDNLADYLAAFVKLRYKNRRVTICAMSFGFLVATKMLQKYPQLVKKVDLLISLVGLVHKDDFKFKRRNYLLMRWGSSFFSNALPAWFAKNVALKGPFIRAAYRLVEEKHSKLKDGDRAERDKRINFEIVLWKINDIRTYMDTTITMFTANLCNKQIKLPVHHVAVEHDRYFDNAVVEQHLAIIYSKVDMIPTTLPAHAPTVIASAKQASPFIPKRLRKILAQ
jgi:pimeloyl-ACP methyl ester carboxylesterase